MRLAVTGTSGQVASSLLECGPARGVEVVTVGRPELDLASASPDDAIRALEAASPDVIVSAAAYTAVDRAESDAETAHAVNCRGAAAIAQAAKQLGVPLVHLSTDYVFSGTTGQPRRESDATAPLGVYGLTKLDGEHRVTALYGENTAILRTAWVYSPFGGNFVKTMLRLAGERPEISVVSDQIGNPTSALDIAEGVLTVARNLVRSPDPALRGTFHMAATGEASWADLAEETFKISRRFGGPQAEVRRISTEDYPTPARRPADARLDSSRIKLVHGVVMPTWQWSLAAVVERLVGKPGVVPLLVRAQA
ncbi:dTDP-4-dehydrorhamnose reductase [Novosphingobium sp. PhB165]|uniref:dTDP-4-dehydrorhamnose reductase n=1 Tax=Novosphingobium sp. PhB165 TaxID=2485105 RepID=UPI0010468F47|nr:dTDP-4-dehydrorhamnose reductase [Novosphingobium sp. PhB165]TCM20809.1 dTDP-4-dehydrorhamnose reductase [Novosphingobium sp. PhB165]